MLGFKKDKVSSRLRYLNLTAEFHGTGYYQLKKGTDNLKFKEIVAKVPFVFFYADKYLNHYVIPEKYKTNTEVSFIHYRFPSNMNESNSQGLYVVKKK